MGCRQSSIRVWWFLLGVTRCSRNWQGSTLFSGNLIATKNFPPIYHHQYFSSFSFSVLLFFSSQLKNFQRYPPSTSTSLFHSRDLSLFFSLSPFVTKPPRRSQNMAQKSSQTVSENYNCVRCVKWKRKVDVFCVQDRWCAVGFYLTYVTHCLVTAAVAAITRATMQNLNKYVPVYKVLL